MSAKVIKFPYVPRPQFVLELHSERMVDALYALNCAGFRVTYMRGSHNRFRIDDERFCNEETHSNE